ncbi:CDP-alcohol phosphatidyltransferase family protein [Halobaculum sp. MBLA0143]|uniref:CDP-alcohol phosphatidyltransferase family protein n=1 Tax=Halobaculum sp. MBLA0143 TaxID=3079933 RepID=UPI0035231DFF
MTATARLPRRLRAEAAVAVSGSGVALALGYLLLTGIGGLAETWLAVAAPAGFGVAVYLRRNLPDNHPADGTVAGLRRTLGVANAVTLARGLAYAGAAGFLFVPRTTAVAALPAVLYGGGVLLDAVDGVVARRVGQTTRLGERLDMAYDTLGFVVAPAVAVAWGRLPAVYLALAAARYLYRAGLTVERRRGRRIRPLPPGRFRRPLAGWQMLFLTVALSPVVPATTLHAVAPVALAPSLLVFARDYLAVTGRLPRHGTDPSGRPADD